MHRGKDENALLILVDWVRTNYRKFDWQKKAKDTNGLDFISYLETVVGDIIIVVGMRPLSSSIRSGSFVSCFLMFRDSDGDTLLDISNKDVGGVMSLLNTIGKYTEKQKLVKSLCSKEVRALLVL